jgi:hypothetical protein
MTTTVTCDIAFIDCNVDDLATLIVGIRPDVEAILLPDDERAPQKTARDVAR